jgi:peptidoglycan/xylan/chitin deacetylase (PgdA/CDA1 family)
MVKRKKTNQPVHHQAAACPPVCITKEFVIMRYCKTLISTVLIIGISGPLHAQPRPAPETQTPNRMAVTFDDLPLNIASHVSDGEMDSIVTRLVGEIEQEKFPVTAFVNEKKLEVNGVRDPERVRILKKFLDAGVELGNHTYSHLSANAVSVDAYEADIVKGERTLKELLAEKGKTLRWFRHPFLHVGRRITARDSIYAFLKQRGCTVAPVTIDNSEWVYSIAFDKAYHNNDTSAMRRWGASYMTYMHSKLKYWEEFSQNLFGRNIRHVLLIHSNRINSFYFRDLCRIIREEGYSFASLDSVMTDPAYQTADTYTGGWGVSWLNHWSITQNKPKSFYANEPRVPQEVMEYAGVESE